LATDHVLVHTGGRDESDLGTGLGKHPPQRTGIQQPEQETDVMADESVLIAMDLAFDRLRELALPPQQSVTFITEIADRLFYTKRKLSLMYLQGEFA
jgi:hypothetical protein